MTRYSVNTHERRFIPDIFVGTAVKCCSLLLNVLISMFMWLPLGLHVQRNFSLGRGYAQPYVLHRLSSIGYHIVNRAEFQPFSFKDYSRFNCKVKSYATGNNVLRNLLSYDFFVNLDLAVSAICVQRQKYGCIKKLINTSVHTWNWLQF